MPGAAGEAVWQGWVHDAYLCRYGNQDIFRLRGLSRGLTVREKLLFRAAIAAEMAREFTLPGTPPTQ